MPRPPNPRRREDARFLYKRCPPHVRDSQPQLQAAFRALQFLWQRDYAGLWPLLRSGWDPHQATLVRGIASNLREHVLRLVATAYSTISLQALAGALGATLPEAQQGEWAHVLAALHAFHAPPGQACACHLALAGIIGCQTHPALGLIRFTALHCRGRSTWLGADERPQRRSVG